MQKLILVNTESWSLKRWLNNFLCGHLKDSSEPVTTEKFKKDTIQLKAPAAAEYYMAEAIKSIDGFFGDGHAKANPALVAEFMRTSALDANLMMEKEKFYV